MIDQGSKLLRELTRILVRNLGVLQKEDASCCGVTIAQCHAIVEIGRKEMISLVELADLLGVDKSTMSRTVNTLVEDDLVTRELDSKNRRYVVITLTQQGKSIFANIEESMKGYYNCIFKSIPAEKRNQVLESLEILGEAVKTNKCCK